MTGEDIFQIVSLAVVVIAGIILNLKEVKHHDQTD